jgi:glucose-1-phosphate thymidylyltransferase
MVRVAGKPILGHILDDAVESPVEDVVVVVGTMRETVVEYVSREYGAVLDVTFVEQEPTDGLAHSVYQAAPVVDDDPACIALGDMLFDSEYEAFLDAHDALDGVDGSIGVQRVDEPSNYGVVTTREGRITDLEEKPEDPDSNLAISGFYVVERSEWLFDAIEYLLSEDRRGAGGEYQLTDALARMVEEGADLGTFEVGDWYDCGRPETLLEANRVLLERVADDGADHGSSVVLPPVDVGEDVTLERSVVGPYVSIDDGARVRDSRVANAIVGRSATVDGANLRESIVGDAATVTGTPNELNVGDSSDVTL